MGTLRTRIGGLVLAAAATIPLGIALAGPALATQKELVPPGPAAKLMITGLSGGRNVTLGPNSYERSVALGPRETFTATAASGNSRSYYNRLIGQQNLTCDGVSQTVPVDTGWVVGNVQRNFGPLACPVGTNARTATVAVHAESLDSAGALSSTTPTATLGYSFIMTETRDVSVTEAAGQAGTGLTLYPGDQVQITGSGSIWAGVWFTGTNGPEGWANTDCAPKFPLPCSHPYSLIARHSDGWFYVGSQLQFSDLSASPLRVSYPSQLILGINDDVPNNGSGQFNAHIVVTHAQS